MNETEMRVRIRRRMPLSAYLLTAALGIAGGVYIWKPIFNEIRRKNLAPTSISDNTNTVTLNTNGQERGNK